MTWYFLMGIKNTDRDLYPYQTIINLNESSISPDVIASQLDLSINEVENTLRANQVDNKIKEESIIEASQTPKMGMLSLDTIFDIGSAIEDAQKRTWVNLKVKSEFNIPLESTQELLEKFVNTNIVLIILNVDLVSSTKLSMDLPLKRLVPIVQTYTQEMSLIIEAYGGYVFKYIGDAILAFFFTKKDDLYLPCNNAINCGYSMIKVIEEGINSILEENGYPELYIRVGIDVGENAVVRYGLMTYGYRINKEKNVKENYP